MTNRRRPEFRVARLAESGRVFHALLEDGDIIRELDIDPFGHDSPGADPHTTVRAAAARAAKSPGRPGEGLTWLAPCAPSKIVGVGRNYLAHIAELHHAAPEAPLFFLKPPSAILPPGGTIRLPSASSRVDFEGELGVVIGRTASRVSEELALDYVLGYTCVNDVTARDLQQKDVQFTRAKGFDTFCPFGPCIALGLAPDDLVVETFVNGQRRQSSPVSRMIFGLARLISYISHVMTLQPGDLIATGTPEGVGPLAQGDQVTVAIEGIGRLTNDVDSAGEPGK
ncbi:MAG TPA: fumarylacetoacetate hydrolase family protein [Candidatus Polarisedimenticolia bacterium]|nr:fumarylacetoacetate hydrolase family protein [Candidatus Polarisedimenticolia bacterium]